MNAWKPLLDGDFAARALEAVRSIAEEIPRTEGWIPAAVREDGAASWSTNLASGTAGQALFYAYLALQTESEEHGDLALDLLDRAAAAVAAVSLSESLYAGFSGIAWVSDHLRGRLFEADEENNAEIDQALLSALAKTPWQGHYDLINGLVGLGIYALEGLPRPAAAACLEQIVQRLGERSEETAEGFTWFYPPEALPLHQRQEHPQGLYNLGASHGVPGVIALLGAACAAGIATEAARPLLAGAVSWLLARRLDPARGSWFSHVYDPGAGSPRSRLAWCYGDLGIAATLLSAARGAGETSWERQAVEIARAAAGRSEENAGVQDAGLCHGAAGVAHLFNRMFQMTGEEKLGEAARRWFDRTLALRTPGLGAGGFRSLSFDGPTGARDWRDDPGFLEGSAGVGLALLAAVSSLDPEWDRLLIPALPERAAAFRPE